MKQLLVICCTVFLVLLKSNGVTSQTEDEKKFAQAVIAKYTLVKDDFSSGVTEARVKYKNFPNVGFGNKISFTFEIFLGSKKIAETVFLLNFNKGDFSITQWKFKAGNTADTPDKDIKSLEKTNDECVKRFTLQGSTYKGSYPACGSPRQDGKLVQLNISLNCTHYSFSALGKNAVFALSRIFNVPKNIAPAKPLCPI